LKEPHGIALDVENQLAFIAGAGNHMLAVLDLTNMKMLGTYPVGDDPDVLAFDPGLKQLYVSAESGDVWVYRVNGKGLVAVGNFSMPPQNASRLLSLREHRWTSTVADHGTSFGFQIEGPFPKLFNVVRSIAFSASLSQHARQSPSDNLQAGGRK
jgi:hypothetical protein